RVDRRTRGFLGLIQLRTNATDRAHRVRRDSRQPTARRLWPPLHRLLGPDAILGSQAAPKSRSPRQSCVRLRGRVARVLRGRIRTTVASQPEMPVAILREESAKQDRNATTQSYGSPCNKCAIYAGTTAETPWTPP